MPVSSREPPETNTEVKRALSRWDNEGGARGHSTTQASGSSTSDDAGTPPEIVTRSGFHFHVRPVTTADAVELARLMAAISEDDVRFRFPTNGQRTLERMSRVDHERTENFIAIDRSGAMVATAMLASGASGNEAEVAIAAHANYRHRGIGWMLLDYMVRYAQHHGLSSLESTQSRDDHTVVDLETEMGFVASPYPGDPSRVLLTKNFAARGPCRA